MLYIGKVTEVFANHGVFVAQLEVGSEVHVGTQIHFLGTSYCIKQKIDSLHINDVEVKTVIADKPSFEVGIKCIVNPRKRMEIFVDT